jgi:hypothetical protein
MRTFLDLVHIAALLALMTLSAIRSRKGSSTLIRQRGSATFHSSFGPAGVFVASLYHFRSKRAA